jgi:hypothetical protein
VGDRYHKNERHRRKAEKAELAGWFHSFLSFPREVEGRPM